MSLCASPVKLRGFLGKGDDPWVESTGLGDRSSAVSCKRGEIEGLKRGGMAQNHSCDEVPALKSSHLPLRRRPALVWEALACHEHEEAQWPCLGAEFLFSVKVG